MRKLYFMSDLAQDRPIESARDDRLNRVGTLRFRREKARKRLSELLSSCDDGDFLRLIWAVDALQSGRQQHARRWLTAFPSEAVTTDLGSKLNVHKWELETLVNQALRVPKRPLRPGLPNRRLNPQAWAAVAALVNELRQLENAEAGFSLARSDVFFELHRIAQRQFPWQRGHFHAPQFFKWAFIYGGDACKAYFEKKNGLTISQLSHVGFALYTALIENPAKSRTIDMSTVGISNKVRDAALPLLAFGHREARAEAVKATRQAWGVAYGASVVRIRPLIADSLQPQLLLCPLIELLLLRVTSGVYYDLISGPGDLRNEIADRFVQYAAMLLRERLAGFEVANEYKYKIGTNEVDTPDLLVRNAGDLRLVIECKAKKMPVAARFSENPMEEAESAFDEIAKGVLQLWRFFSHVRRGLVPGATVFEDTRAMLLTADSWLSMSGPLRRAVLDLAHLKAKDDANLLPEDKRPIIFCSIEDAEMTLQFSTAETFFSALAAATLDKYEGWMLPSVLREVAEEVDNGYPFAERLAEVLPWWAEAGE